MAVEDKSTGNGWIRKQGEIIWGGGDGRLLELILQETTAGDGGAGDSRRQQGEMVMEGNKRWRHQRGQYDFAMDDNNVRQMQEMVAHKMVGGDVNKQCDKRKMKMRP